MDAAAAAGGGALLRADTDRDGRLSPADDAGRGAWTARRGAIMLPNLDDDTARCPTTGKGGGRLTDAALAACDDAADSVVNGAADVADLARGLDAEGLREPFVESPAGGDRWMGDMCKAGYASMPGPGGREHRIVVNLRSPAVTPDFPARDRPLRDASRPVFTMLRGPGVAGVQQFDAGAVDRPDDNLYYGSASSAPAATWPRLSTGRGRRAGTCSSGPPRTPCAGSASASTGSRTGTTRTTSARRAAASTASPTSSGT
ncbi:hypothetical protein H4W34_006625 [Actinomadura algeriensis]|uniref:Uncharacterized protein n=1 Tax=Actinomadura algeriensis TaxID=1679523 RepID=A0ABR9K1T6_9ACTN|nr:hypothetical protein [Actinomadura algeriensis]MBE1536792.1 hypothetical protein [Actinomadura algeriensis]